MAFKLWENGTPGFNPASEQEEPNLTPYIVDTDKPAGCVIVCPGGGYGHLAYHEGEPIAQMLNASGIHAFVLRYRLSPDYHHPAMEQDINRAVRWVRYHAAEYNINPEKIDEYIVTPELYPVSGLIGAYLVGKKALENA